MDYTKLNEKEIQHIKDLLEKAKKAEERQLKYQKKYINSDKGRIKRKEANKRYYQKKKDIKNNLLLEEMEEKKKIVSKFMEV